MKLQVYMTRINRVETWRLIVNGRALPHLFVSSAEVQDAIDAIRERAPC